MIRKILCLLGFHEGVEDIWDLPNSDTVTYYKCEHCGKYIVKLLVPETSGKP